MELAEYNCNPDDENSKVTLCDANIVTYLSGKHNVLHIFFLKEQQRIPMMGLVSYNYDDIWNIDVNKLGQCYTPFNFGKRRLPKWIEKGGLVSGDSVQVQFTFDENVMYLRLGKNRREWTRALSTSIDKSVKISFVVESAKENFFIIRDDLYLDYLLNGIPRELRNCASCCDDKDRIVVTKCGHYLCISCWYTWTKNKMRLFCFICQIKVDCHVIARIRDSPCPVDHCRSGDGNQNYVLVPCGCVARCFVKDTNGDGMDSCPYELCGEPVQSKWPLYLN